MDKRVKVSPQNTAKPYKLIALFSLLFIALLSFLFIIWSHPHKPLYANKKLSLPKIEEIKESEDVTDDHGWTTITTRSGDSLSTIFNRVGLNRRTLQEVLRNNPHAKTLAKIKPGEQIQFFVQNKILEKMIFPVSTAQYLVVAHEGKNYVSTIKLRKMNSQNDYVTATVQGSLYTTARRQNIPYKLIRQMTDIFNWEIDFVKDIRAGDQFSILYEAYYIDDKLVNTGDILAVMYTARDKTHSAIRHVSASGDFDYFTPEGISLKKAFSRYPLKFSHISSSYSLSRYHPILHYSRPHKGVDLAASLGTPIHATGDGRIELIDRDNSYGNMVKINHNKTYASLYAHLLKFQKGLSKGDYVKRGQVIGYVGQTGLADGPHCHYEFHINHQPKNPTTVPLPRSLPVPRREASSFRAKANKLLAQLKLYEAANLADKGKKTNTT